MRLSHAVTAIVCGVCAAPALAGTIIGSSSTPSSAKLPAGGSVTVQHNFDIKYFNNESFGCGARLSFSDGTPSENLTIKKPQDKVTKTRQYSAGGTYSATLEGFAHSGLVACLGSQTTSVNIQGATLQVQGPIAALVKAKLTSLTLQQTTLPVANPTAIVYSLSADKPVANCQLTYELKTNNTGADTINISLIGPMDYSSPSGGWTLPIQNQNLAFGTLMFNGQMRTGPLRFILRAKDVPDNTCSGQAQADFEIKDGPKLSLSPATLAQDVTRITGVSVAGNWYDFLQKRYTISLKGTGKGNCSYHLEFHNDTLGKVVSTYDSWSTLPMELLDTSADLPAGNYTITLKGRPSDNPAAPTCLGQASTTAKITAPADAMRIQSSTMTVTKTDNSVLTQQDVSLPIATLKAITLDVNFTNIMNLAHNTPNSCAYKVAVSFPGGGSMEGYHIAQGAADKGIVIDYVSNQGIYGKGPGVYTIHIEGTATLPGNSQAIACVGSSDHKITLAPSLSGVKVQPGVLIKQ
jgi:hypothetical protein